jgi:phosphotriesterase-related protein
VNKAKATRRDLLTGLILGLVAQYPALAQSSSGPPVIPDIAGKVLTVRGPVSPSLLGETLMHEHIFVHFQLPIADTRDHATDEAVARQQLSLANLAAVRSGVWNPDNDFLGDFATSYDELMDFRRGGGGT